MVKRVKDNLSSQALCTTRIKYAWNGKDIFLHLPFLLFIAFHPQY